ncbi:MAG: hypothetical protein ACKVVP_00550 [Chloroflexota bacterium]
MKHVRLGLIALGAGLSIYLAPAGPALAAHEAYDGQVLQNQPEATQRLFQSTWGDQAAVRWGMEHTMELVAKGQAPASALSAYPQAAGMGTGMGMGQSGAQITDPGSGTRNGQGMDDEANPSSGDSDDDD